MSDPSTPPPPSRPAGDVAVVSVQVRVPPEVAFEVFTREIDQWWRTGPQYRVGGRHAGRLILEPHLEGRLFETFEIRGSPRTLDVGRVLVWEPPARLVLEWRGVNFKPGESTRVDVDFSPSGDGTKVTVRHAGWSSLPAGHPARHGLEGAAFVRMIGLWWGGLMTSLREHVAAR